MDMNEEQEEVLGHLIRSVDKDICLLKQGAESGREIKDFHTYTQLSELGLF